MAGRPHRAAPRADAHRHLVVVFHRRHGLGLEPDFAAVTRALFGMGEAGCFPNLTRIFTLWLPQRERERAQASLWLAARWGGAFTPLLVAYVLDFVSWRRAFELFGLLGRRLGRRVLSLVPRRPSNAPDASMPPRLRCCRRRARARSHTGRTPWGSDLLRALSVWLLGLQYVCAVVWLVLLRDVAAHLPARSPRHEHQDGGAPGRAAAAARWRRAASFPAG